MKRRMIALLLSLAMLASLLMVGLSVSASTNGKTADQAIAWVQSKSGQTIEADGSAKGSSTYAQCLDLVKAYCEYLGVPALGTNNIGAKYYSYTAAGTYFSKYGWKQIANAKPQKGDILVYTGGSKNSYGHVAVYESDYVTWHQNYNSHPYVEKRTVHYTLPGESAWTNYWGVIRPDFSGSPTPTPTPKPMTKGAGQTIRDGDYWIVSGINQDYFLDVPGDTANVASKTNVQVWKWGNKMPSQYDVYHFEYKGNGFYKIIHKASGLALDVYGAEMKNGTNAWLFTNYEHDAQLWSISGSGTGYKIQSKCNSLFLDVKSAAYADGTNVQLWEGNNSAAQNFGLIPYNPNLRPVEDGVYTIRINKDKNWVVDCQGYENYPNNTNIQLWKEPNDENADKYKIVYAGDGYYYIYENSTGRRLDAYNGEDETFLKSGKNVQLFENSSSRGQLWMITKESNGTYRFWNKLSGLCLDLNGGTVADRQNFMLYYYGGNVQTFLLNRQAKDISYCDVTFSPSTCVYDGTQQKPSVTVKDGNKVLTNGVDYTFNYHSNINVGYGAISLYGKGNYTGGVMRTFIIEKAPESAHTHTWVNVPAVDATCTETGLTAGVKCSECGEWQKEPTVVAVKAHTPKDVAALPATCIEDGLTAGKVCAVCGKVLEEQKVVPALGHDFQNGRCTRCDIQEKDDTPIIPDEPTPTPASKQNGLANAAASDGNWYYYKDGIIDKSHNGVDQNKYGWWRVENGKVNFNAMGIYQNGFGWWKTTNGKVTFKEEGVFQNGFGWWRVKDSKVDFNAQSVYQNQYGWWKTTNGKVTFKENGLFKNQYGTWKVENSKVNFNFNGKYQGKTIKNGKVV